MRSFLFFISLFLLLFSLESCYKEEVIFNVEANNSLELPLILRINNKDCAFDYTQNTLRYPIEKDSIINFEAFIEFQDYSEVVFNNQSLKNNLINNLGEIRINKQYEINISTNNTVKVLKLIFTNLPIVQLITPSRIYDEPKSLARFVINFPNQNTISSYVGIEQRGGWETLQLPKKSYSFSFLNSTFLDEKTPYSVFDLEQNTDWVLDGMYTDNTRLRNKIASNIWKAIPGEKHYGISPNFVELYFNNEHQGLYCLSENINAELLLLSNNDALLYKAIGWNGPPCFETSSDALPSIERWDGWVQKYPNPNQRINWEPLADLRNLIVESSDEDFILQIGTLIDIDNFIDYYLFLNLICARDNLGKNIFLTKQSLQEPLAIIPWDFDNSFESSGIQPIVNNNLYKRLSELNPNNFNKRLKDRWIFLRIEAFQASNLLSIIEISSNQIQKSNIIEIENEKWATTINIETEHSNLMLWIVDRLNTMDNYYQNL